MNKISPLFGYYFYTKDTKNIFKKQIYFHKKDGYFYGKVKNDFKAI